MRKIKETLEPGMSYFVGDKMTVIKLIYDRIIINQVMKVEEDENILPFTRSIIIDLKKCEIDKEGNFIYNEDVKPVDGLLVTAYEPQYLRQYLRKYILHDEHFVEMDSDGKQITPIFLFYHEMVESLIDKCTEEM